MATPRPRPQVISLTDAAAERIKYVMANATKPVVGVRVGVKNGGCAGHDLHDGICRGASAKTDEVVEDKGVRVLIDPKAVLGTRKRRGCSCSARDGLQDRQDVGASSSSTIRTRPRPAAAAKSGAAQRLRRSRARRTAPRTPTASCSGMAARTTLPPRAGRVESAAGIGSRQIHADCGRALGGV